MMDKIDLELCLDVEELAAKSHRERLETSFSVCEHEQDESQSSSVSGAEAGTVRSWEQIDQTLDGSGRDGPNNNEVPARKRTRISISGSWRESRLRDYTMDDTQEDPNMIDPRDATLIGNTLESTQKFEDDAEDESNSFVSADDGGHDDPSSSLETGRHLVSDAVDTNSTTDIDERYIQEQSRLPLTPLLLGPPGSNYYSITRKGTLISSSHNRPEKATEKTHFTIYEDPAESEDTDMDTIDTDMDIDMDIDIDIDNDDDSDDSEDPQQWTSYGHLSDDKENADENYDDDGGGGNSEQRTDLQQLGTQTETGTHSEMQISFDEAETESDTETIIQEHALTRHIVPNTTISTRMDEEREDEENIEAIPEREQDDNHVVDVDYIEDDDSMLAASSRGHRRRRRDITTNDSSDDNDNSNGDSISAVFPRREIRTYPYVSFDSSNLGRAESLFSDLSSQSNSIVGQHLQPSQLAHSTLSSPSSSSSLRRRRRPYRPRAFN